MKLTKPMLHELRSIARDGNPSDPDDWNHAPEGLWFHARDRVLGALIKRGLIHEDSGMSGYSLSASGQAELAKVGEP